MDLRTRKDPVNTVSTRCSLLSVLSQLLSHLSSLSSGLLHIRAADAGTTRRQGSVSANGLRAQMTTVDMDKF